MKTGIFTTVLEKDGSIKIPAEIIDRIKLNEGDKLEILVKKIRSGKFEVSISKNPLYKLLKISENKVD